MAGLLLHKISFCNNINESWKGQEPFDFIHKKKSNKWTKKTYKQVDIQKYGAYKRENEEGKGDIWWQKETWVVNIDWGVPMMYYKVIYLKHIIFLTNMPKVFNLKTNSELKIVWKTAYNEY